MSFGYMGHNSKPLTEKRDEKGNTKRCRRSGEKGFWNILSLLPVYSLPKNNGK